jgi:hypothetical protein
MNKRVGTYIFRVVIAFVPLIGWWLTKTFDVLPALWPPLGSFNEYGASTLSWLIVLIGWIGPEMFKKGSEASARNNSLLLGILAFLIYAALLIGFVKTFKKLDGRTVHLTIGYERSAAAKQRLEGKSDGEVLEAAGTEEKDIEKAWEPRSVWLVRYSIAITYFGVLAFLNLAVGLHLKSESDSIISPTEP